MLSLSQKNEFVWGFYQGYTYKATYHWAQSDLDSVIVSMNKALQYAKQLDEDGKISACYNRMAMAHTYLGQYDKAKELTYKALDIAKKSNNWEGLYFSYYRLGNTFYYENDFDNALVNYLKVDSIFQHHERKEPALAASLSNIGQIYMELDNFDKSEEYFVRSKDLYKSMNRTEGEMYIGFNMGKLEFNKGNYQNSIDLFTPPLQYYETAASTNDVSDIAGWIGAAHLKLNQFGQAREFYEKSIDLAKKTENKMLVANGLIGLADVEKHYGNADIGISHLNEAWNIYESLNVSYNKSQILNGLATAYLEKKEYKKAYEYLEAYQSLNDSILKEQNAQKVNELETQYDTAKKEQEISLLKSQNELAEQQKRNQRNLLLGGIGITSLAGFFLLFLLRNRRKTTKKLRELDQLKSKFFANISHEFRTPLTLISGPLEKRLEAKKLSKTDQKDFEMMQRNSKRLLNLVDQLLDLSKLEVGKYQLQISEGNLGYFLKTLAEAFVFSAEENQIVYETKVDDLKSVWYDQDSIEKITVNLLSNAFKYTDNGGNIDFTAKQVSKELVLNVSNTPTELKSSSIEQFFSRFYQVDSHKDGVGIGLSLVRELVHLHKGVIEVNQPEENTLQFSITLPLNKEAFKSELLTATHPEILKPITTPHVDALESDAEEINLIADTDILLVVEDNGDVRQFIKASFENEYQVVLANDGQEGIAKALEYVPDLIISDIMMPKTDGLELCKQLKSDERTSHVPIILLTAKADEEHQYEGLKHGADAYVTKPFNSKLLQTRVAKLIASRKELRNRYSQEVILMPKDIAITNLDEQFLNRVQDVLDSKLTTSSFSTQEFSESVGMSRMQLHRKLKALTGLSASEFVRSQRLKLAASLLEQSDINVSQIGYQVGFNDPSYFTKCFKEAYGVSPSQYGKNRS
ncbi:response regulator [Flagellimonas sp.]|uniref:response regulator n=1 Tax=Flagellimonas sp. TaxID=2058762 RepID=UPI003F49C30C